jgi:hypothetical protein
VGVERVLVQRDVKNARRKEVLGAFPDGENEKRK